MTIPFESINAAALSALPQLLQDWFPHGKRRGKEYLIGDLSGAAGESLSINMNTCQWADFANDRKGGDPISLCAEAFHSGDRVKAAKALGSRFGLYLNGSSATAAPRLKADSIRTSKPKTGDSDPTFLAAPPPPDAPPPPLEGADQLHIYRDALGAPVRYIRRYEKTPHRAKYFTPATWGEMDGITGWHKKAAPKPHILYGLDRLAAAAPDATVLICEGEKSADAAQALYPNMPCVTWSGGTGNVPAADWSPLAGRSVIIWPDNDPNGIKAAAKLSSTLSKIASKIQTLRVDDLNVKDDAANVHPENPTQWLKERLIEIEKEITIQDDKDEGISKLISEFNGKYFIVNEAGRALIYQPAFDTILQRSRFERISFDDLRKFYLNRMVKVGENASGHPILKNAASVWLSHRDRRQFIGGVRFDPTGAVEEGVLNLWQGFGVTPRPGCWKTMQSHILSIIADSNPAHRDYIMGWMARLVQRPAEPGEVAIVLRGGEGTGKGMLARALIRILGQHGLKVDNAKHLVGNFNAHLRDAVFLFADEAFFAGDRANIGTLKSLITEPYFMIEGKYQNAVQTPNFLHIFMSSNEDWVVPASKDSRRYAVLDVCSAAQGSREYFNEIANEMNNGGYEAMLYDLLHYDLSNFDVTDHPITAGLQQQRKLSLPVSDRWWMDCLMRGYVFESRMGLEKTFSVWMPEISTDLLFKSYETFARKHGERHPMAREALGRFMAQFGKAAHLRNKSIGEHMVSEPAAFGSSNVARAHIKPRVCCYSLGSLKYARDKFTEVTKLPVEWEKDEADENWPDG